MKKIILQLPEGALVEGNNGAVYFDAELLPPSEVTQDQTPGESLPPTNETPTE